MTAPLLEVSISADYPGKPCALDGVEFTLDEGEAFGLVGESGSGKSTLAMAVLGLLEWKGGRRRGSLRFRGREMGAAGEAEWRRVRGKEIALVPQSPIESLNPALRLRSQFREAWRAHRGEALDMRELGRLLECVSLPADPGFLERFPAELSVGQGQRVLIAMALLHKPSLILADEPTSALDVITQGEILALLRRMNREEGATLLFISHDLLSVGALCHRVGVLREGQMVEVGETRRVLTTPRHEYTRKLVEAIPRLEYQA